EDIAPLLERFFGRYNLEMGGRLRGIGQDALEWFLAYTYPGNVRELENLVERAVALESGHELSAEHLPAQPPAASPGPTSRESFPDAGVDLDGRLADLERELIEGALLKTEGVRREASDLLGVSERSLRYRMSKLGIGV